MNLSNIHLNSRSRLLIGISLGFLVLFIIFAYMAQTSPQINNIDNSILIMLVQKRSPALTTFILIITSLGDITTVVSIGVLAVIYFMNNKNQAYAYILGGVLSFNILIINLTKIIIERERPPIQYALINADSYSFPSGHTLIAISLYIVFAYLLGKTRVSKSIKIPVYAFTVMLVLLIGFSRLYLGVHWFSDVIASLILGSTLITLLIAGTNSK